MTTPPTSATNSHELLKTQGIYYFEDAAIGSMVQKVDSLGLSRSAESWAHFEGIILGNPQVRQILEPFLGQSRPRKCFTFGAEPGEIFCFWPEPDQAHRLVVSVWSTGTKIKGYNGSHTGTLTAVLASNGLFEVHPTTLDNRGLKARAIQMDEGGITIVDVRFAIERKAGFMIAYPLEKKKQDAI